MDNWNHAKEEKKYMIMKKNKIALISEDGETYQFVHDAVDYIENNWKNIGKVGRFKIYETIEK